MNPLYQAVNEAFFKAYPSAVDIIGQGQGLPKEEYEHLLAKRVEMLLDDLLKTRDNFHVTNRAYADLDCKHRGIRQHWYQFWRRHGRT